MREGGKEGGGRGWKGGREGGGRREGGEYTCQSRIRL